MAPAVRSFSGLSALSGIVRRDPSRTRGSGAGDAPTQPCRATEANLRRPSHRDSERLPTQHAQRPSQLRHSAAASPARTARQRGGRSPTGRHRLGERNPVASSGKDTPGAALAPARRCRSSDRILFEKWTLGKRSSADLSSYSSPYCSVERKQRRHAGLSSAPYSRPVSKPVDGWALTSSDTRLHRPWSAGA